MYGSVGLHALLPITLPCGSPTWLSSHCVRECTRPRGCTDSRPAIRSPLRFCRTSLRTWPRLPFTWRCVRHVRPAVLQSRPRTTHRHRRWSVTVTSGHRTGCPNGGRTVHRHVPPSFLERGLRTSLVFRQAKVRRARRMALDPGSLINPATICALGQSPRGSA